MIPEIPEEPPPAPEPDIEGHEVLARSWTSERGITWHMAVTRQGRRYLVYGSSNHNDGSPGGKMATKDSGRADLEETIRYVAWTICRAVLAEAILDQLEEGK